MLLAQRQRDIEAKNEIYGNLRRTESEKTQVGAQLEKVQRDSKRVDVER